MHLAISWCEEKLLLKGGVSQHTKGVERPTMVHAILWWRLGETASYRGDFDHPGKKQLKQGRGSRARDISKGFLNPGKGWQCSGHGLWG